MKRHLAQFVTLVLAMILMVSNFSVTAFAASSYDVTFRTEEGGKINDDTLDVVYLMVKHGSKFPVIPEEEPDKGFEFDGWYDENDQKVEEFPLTVTQDYEFTAKWKKSSAATDPTEETKPEETKPEETKPEETKPEETKPEETKPEETKPEETKPQETKPDEPVFTHYVIRQYFGQTDGSYKELVDPIYKSAKVGDEIKLTPGEYKHYIFNKSKSVLTGTVIFPETANEYLTLKLYYDLEEVEYRVNIYEQTSRGSTKYSLNEYKTYKAPYGAKVTVKPASRKNYIFVSSKSTVTGKASKDLVLDLYYNINTPDPNYNPIISVPPAQDPTTPSNKNVDYTVEHYVQSTLGDYDLLETETHTVEEGTPVAAKPKDYEAFSFNNSKSNVTGVADENGLVLKLYYDLLPISDENVVESTTEQETEETTVETTEVTINTEPSQLSPNYKPPKSNFSSVLRTIFWIFIIAVLLVVLWRIISYYFAVVADDDDYDDDDDEEYEDFEDL